MKKVIQIEDFLTFETLAEKVGVGTDTVEKWRQKGMPVIKIEKYVRVYYPRVLEWLIKQEEKAESTSNQGSFFCKNGKT